MRDLEKALAAPQSKLESLASYASFNQSRLQYALYRDGCTLPIYHFVNSHMMKFLIFIP